MLFSAGPSGGKRAQGNKKGGLHTYRLVMLESWPSPLTVLSRLTVFDNDYIVLFIVALNFFGSPATPEFNYGGFSVLPNHFPLAPACSYLKFSDLQFWFPLFIATTA